MLMLLSVHVTSVTVLFVVLVGNSALTMGYGLILRLHTLTLVTRCYALLFEYRLSPIDTMIDVGLSRYSWQCFNYLQRFNYTLVIFFRQPECDRNVAEIKTC